METHPKIVCMGGGTGLPQMLSGLRLLSGPSQDALPQVDLTNLTAVITVFDDGGSSGRIVEAYDALPPGDLRNCLLALADETAEPLLTRFFNHRFGENEHEALAGHSAGNLLLLALSQVYGGDIRKAIRAIRQILPIRSTLLFPSECPAILCAQLEDGTIIRGESQIARRSSRAPINTLFLEPRTLAGYPPTYGIPPMDGVLEAIATADIITLGPGSLFTSILPHFLVDGVPEAVNASKACKIYVSNLMIEAGETDGYGLLEHVSSLERISGIQLDAVIANDSCVSAELLRAYHLERMQVQFRKAHRRLERAFERALEAPEHIDSLREEATQVNKRVNAIAEKLEDQEGALIQVLPTDSQPLPERIHLHRCDLLADVEVTERDGGTKRVIRHDPLKLGEATLHIYQQLRSASGTK